MYLEEIARRLMMVMLRKSERGVRGPKMKVRIRAVMVEEPGLECTPKYLAKRALKRLQVK